MATATESSAERDIMYCHQCENEWYRDEHGLTCPECQSDFTEIIEAQHDPRHDDLLANERVGEMEDTADDPEEEDIETLHWQPRAGGTQSGFQFQPSSGWNFSGNTESRPQAQRSEPQTEQGSSGSILGFIGSMLPNIMGLGQQPGQSQYDDYERYDTAASSERHPSHQDNAQQSQVPPPGANSRVRHFRGPGYNVTIATSSSATLFPRNANQPQPFQQNPDQIEQMMQQMLFNIGAFPRRSPTDVHNGVPQATFGAEEHTHPFQNIFQLLGLPFGLGDAHGDAVFSQEALDRVITQLMEQHQSGNAPGPASAQAIAALPQRPISHADLGDSHQADCSICMDSVEVGTMVTELPCHHWFHHDCIGAWLAEHDTCPHCRQGIMPKESPTTDRPRQSSQAPLNQGWG